MLKQANRSFTCFSSIASNDRDREELDEFFDANHNFIILSNAGKPIYSLHGDIYNLSSIYATLYAMISKIQTYKFQPIDVKIPKNDYSEGANFREVGSFGQALNRQPSPNYKPHNNSFENRNSSLYDGSG